MISPLGEVMNLAGYAISFIFNLANAVRLRFVTLVGTPVEFLRRVGLAAGTLFGVLWGWLLFGGLLGLAIGFKMFGVDDTYRSMRRLLSSDDADGALEAVQSVPHEEFTDKQGRFSPAAFERTTGMTPSEFVHLYVASRGGRVKQRTLASCLPWSKPTVSRLLDTLEENGLARRINNGRENIVCTPDALPEDASDGGVYSDFDQ